MKKCPKCGRIHDDSWKVCLYCSESLSTNLTIEPTNDNKNDTRKNIIDKTLDWLEKNITIGRVMDKKFTVSIASIAALIHFFLVMLLLLLMIPSGQSGMFFMIALYIVDFFLKPLLDIVLMLPSVQNNIFIGMATYIGVFGILGSAGWFVICFVLIKAMHLTKAWYRLGKY